MAPVPVQISRILNGLSVLFFNINSASLITHSSVSTRGIRTGLRVLIERDPNGVTPEIYI